MTRFVTLTVQVRPHSEMIEVDGHKFTDPAQLWQYLHSGASAIARKPTQTHNSVFATDETLAALAAAMASTSGGEYRVPPGGVAITRCVPGRGVGTGNQVLRGKSLEELDL